MAAFGENDEFTAVQLMGSENCGSVVGYTSTIFPDHQGRIVEGYAVIQELCAF